MHSGPLRAEGLEEGAREVPRDGGRGRPRHPVRGAAAHLARVGARVRGPAERDLSPARCVRGLAGGPVAGRVSRRFFLDVRDPAGVGGTLMPSAPAAGRRPYMRRILVCLALSVALLPSPVAAQADHLQCFKIKDTTAKTTYTANLTPSDPNFPAATGCTVRVPPRLLCVDVVKSNVVPPPVGAPAGAPTHKFLCYKVKCLKTHPRGACRTSSGPTTSRSSRRASSARRSRCRRPPRPPRPARRSSAAAKPTISVPERRTRSASARAACARSAATLASRTATPTTRTAAR